MNQLIDIRNCPKARGKLRKLQIADTLLLKIFHNICNKHNIKYSLEAGTLLGAIRHKGFIPWDDDLDVTILYQDYDRLIEILNEELKNTNLILYGVKKTRFGNDTLRITHKDFPYLNLDIFYLHNSALSYDKKEETKEIWKRYADEYYSLYKTVAEDENFESLKNFRENLNNKFEKEIETCSFEKAKTLVHKISSDFWFVDKNDFYPLKLAQFEDFEFYIPNKPLLILEDLYEDWQSFPPNISFHGTLFTDFDEEKIEPVIEELKQYIKDNEDGV